MRRLVPARMLAIVGARDLRGYRANRRRARLVAARHCNHLTRRHRRGHGHALLYPLLTTQLLRIRRIWITGAGWRSLLLWQLVSVSHLSSSMQNRFSKYSRHSDEVDSYLWTWAGRVVARALDSPKGFEEAVSPLKAICTVTFLSWAAFSGAGFSGIAFSKIPFSALSGIFSILDMGVYLCRSAWPLSKLLVTIIFTPSWTLHFFWDPAFALFSKITKC